MAGKKGHGGAVAAGMMLASAAAGAYYLFKTKAGAYNRTKLGAWAERMKKDVVRELKGAKKAGEREYLRAVREVSAKYKNLKNIDRAELDALVKDLRGHWSVIKSEVQKSAAEAEKVARSTAKKAKKATTKKAAPRKRTAVKKKSVRKRA